MVTNPRLRIYVLHILQGHLIGFHFRILFVNLDKEKNFISLGTIDQIFGPRCAKDSVPQETDLTLTVLKSFSPGYFARELRGKIMFMIFGDICDFVQFDRQSLDVSFVYCIRFILGKEIIERRLIVSVCNTKCPFVQFIYSAV